MYKKRSFVDGAFYHVISRTNDKIRVFQNNLGRKIMLIILQAAKDKFRFTLANFCVMPTHIHLLIKPAEGTSLSVIMQWVKINSAKYWNKIHGSIDHLWDTQQMRSVKLRLCKNLTRCGTQKNYSYNKCVAALADTVCLRFFARAIKDTLEYEHIMNYIDQNAVVVGLAPTPADWKASGAYYKALNIQGLVDYEPQESNIKLLSPIPPIVSRLIPPAQLSRTLQYYGAYAEIINRLYRTVQSIPRLGETETERKPLAYLRYYTDTVDYFIYEYDTKDTMYGKVRFNVFPHGSANQKINLSALFHNQSIKLDYSWQPLSYTG